VTCRVRKAGITEVIIYWLSRIIIWIIQVVQLCSIFKINENKEEEKSKNWKYLNGNIIRVSTGRRSLD